MKRVLVCISSGISVYCKPQDLAWIHTLLHFRRGQGMRIGVISTSMIEPAEHPSLKDDVDLSSLPVCLVLEFCIGKTIGEVASILQIIYAGGCAVEGENDPDVDGDQWIVDLTGEANPIQYTGIEMLATYLPAYA